MGRIDGRVKLEDEGSTSECLWPKPNASERVSPG